MPRNTAAVEPSVRPNRRSPNSENVASNAVKANIATNPTNARRRRNAVVGTSACSRSVSWSRRVSGRRTMAAIAFAPASTAAT